METRNFGFSAAAIVALRVDSGADAYSPLEAR